MALELDPEITLTIPLSELRGIRDELAGSLNQRGALVVSGIHSDRERDANSRRWVGILTRRIEQAEREQE